MVFPMQTLLDMPMNIANFYLNYFRRIQMKIIPTRPSDIHENDMICVGRDLNSIGIVEIVTPSYARIYPQFETNRIWYSKDNLFKVES